MLREAAVEVESDSTWAFQVPHGDHANWQRVDRALRSRAKRRAALDAEEAHWLREAEACQIWRPLGMVSAIDYMERVLGYGPRAAQERLRIARALGTLPELTAALAQGELSYSAVRELSRVVTPATEAAWRAEAIGKNLRQIEELVADHQPGDNPDDPGDPEIRTHVVRFELSAETFAVLRQARHVLDDEHGSHLSDDELMMAMTGTVLDGPAATEPTGRAKFQIAVTLCERCGQGWQDGAGAKIAIDDASVERALCDAQHIGSIDGDAPERAHQDIPPSVARLVWRRDGGRCRVPGCRSARNLEIHHLVHRADGGSHDAMNLVITCGSCHMAHHRGALMISGTADRVEVVRFGGGIFGRPGAKAREPGAHVGAAGATAEPEGADRRAAETKGTEPEPEKLERTAREAVECKRGKPEPGKHERTERKAAKVNSAKPQPEKPKRSEREAAEANGAKPQPEKPERDEREAAKANGAKPQLEKPARTARKAAEASGAKPQPEKPERTEPEAAEANGAKRQPMEPKVAGLSRLEAAIVRAQIKDALVGLGWTPAIATAAVAAAVALLGPDVPLERLIREALRRCPVPRG